MGFINVTMEKSSSCISVDVDAEGEPMSRCCNSCLAQNLPVCLFSLFLVVTDVFDTFWHFFSFLTSLLALALALLISSHKTSSSESLLLSYGNLPVCLLSLFLVVTDVFDTFWHLFSSLTSLLALALAFLIRSPKTSLSESLLLSYGSL